MTDLTDHGREPDPAVAADAVLADDAVSGHPVAPCGPGPARGEGPDPDGQAGRGGTEAYLHGVDEALSLLGPARPPAASGAGRAPGAGNTGAAHGGSARPAAGHAAAAHAGTAHAGGVPGGAAYSGPGREARGVGPEPGGSHSRSAAPGAGDPASSDPGRPDARHPEPGHQDARPPDPARPADPARHQDPTGGHPDPARHADPTGGHPDPARHADPARHQGPTRPPGAGGTGGPGTGGPGPTRRHRATPWPEATALAARLGRRDTPRSHRLPPADALGHVLAEPLTALCDLPSFDTSAMDGWAVAGPGPWAARPADSILAGHAEAETLEDGTAVRIATGARVPRGVTAVIRSEHARLDEDKRLLHAERAVVPGQDIRPRGQECRTGARLLAAGTVVTPAVIGLAAAAGYDTLATVVPPRAEILVLGDELLDAGLPHDGLIRDALGPMIGPWLRSLGVDVLATRRIADDEETLYRAVTESGADLVITTGGTASGPVDHVHPVLRRAGARLLVDGVAVRPGHPMLLAQLPSERFLVGLPGNPLAAVSGLLTLAEPLLRGLSGRPTARPYRAPVREAAQGHPYDTRLVPFVYDGDLLVPLRFNGPAMLRGIAAADGLAVVPPGGARSGEELDVLDLPWSGWAPAPPGAAPVPGEGCFT
ncbi:molybdopterin-binding protein [Streptomyces sp. NPDC005805]|uniref:molybdopterin molybdotransferase MoeA n=1 Tax=Streptomyces sp. NPDC005805 TaxID=3157068 RepID=UPI00340E11F5